MGPHSEAGLWWRTRDRRSMSQAGDGSRNGTWGRVDRIESGAADVSLATVRGPDGGLCKGVTVG